MVSANLRRSSSQLGLLAVYLFGVKSIMLANALNEANLSKTLKTLID